MGCEVEGERGGGKEDYACRLVEGAGLVGVIMCKVEVRRGDVGKDYACRLMGGQAW